MAAILNYLKYPILVSSSIVAAASGVLYWKQKFVDRFGQGNATDVRTASSFTHDTYQRGPELKRVSRSQRSSVSLTMKMSSSLRQMVKLLEPTSSGQPTEVLLDQSRF